MTNVDVGSDGFIVDAGLVAKAFALSEADVQKLMKSGGMMSRCEKGVDEDEGRWRLTFFHQDRALRLTLDGSGQILSQSTFNAPRRNAGTK
ncbi:hypothetical protein SuNHUV7_06130 (plasmid) [Pseudoseohaeicola sp. NH-UV-7]|uniref:DUF6522 family protein n=1 Tax=Sulfitobacter sp. TBRI5 TaxID=2989732 RepID=UPI003A78AAF0